MTVFYTSHDGIKQKESKPFKTAIEIHCFITDLMLADCKDIFVENNGIFYDWQGNILECKDFKKKDFIFLSYL